MAGSNTGPAKLLRPFLGAVLLFAATLAACAGQEGVRPSWKLHDADFKAIQPGASEAEVVQRVGNPILKTEFKRLHETVWDYRYMDGVLVYVAEIHFDMQGKVTRMEHYPDQCAMRAIPCR